MFFTEYKVKYWEETTNKKISSGITCGDTLSENVDRIVAYYGEDNIEELTIKYLDDTDCGVWEKDDEY